MNAVLVINFLFPKWIIILIPFPKLKCHLLSIRMYKQECIHRHSVSPLIYVSVPAQKAHYLSNSSFVMF